VSVALGKRSLLGRYPGGITVSLDDGVVLASGWRGAGVVPMCIAAHGDHTGITPGRNQGHTVAEAKRRLSGSGRRQPFHLKQRRTQVLGLGQAACALSETLVDT
jgi:hypothetical protein